MTSTKELTDSVLLAVEAIPAGRLATYGDLARVVGCGPRQVARVLSSSGGSVPWWRVVRADGTIAAPLVSHAARLLGAEGITVRAGRVDLAEYRVEFQ